MTLAKLGDDCRRRQASLDSPGRKFRCLKPQVDEQVALTPVVDSYLVLASAEYSEAADKRKESKLDPRTKLAIVERSSDAKRKDSMKVLLRREGDFLT